ncbi:MAG: HpcH/HpaI aldolase/citrate lyase family protein [Thermoanaerobaculia bacterium]
MRGPASILCRSLLMTCALHPHQYGRARECGADIGTIDLEDGVPPSMKEAARQVALPILAGEAREGFSRALRINSLRTEEGLRDLLAVIESDARPDILFLPKVESAEELVIADQVLAGRFPSMVLLATIETAAGLAAVDEVAAAPVARLWGLIFGAADLSADLGTTLDWEVLLHARSRIQLAAARSGLRAIDAPCFEVHDRETLGREVEGARRMGFAGKAAIHPWQVEAINRGYTPDGAAVARAREILAASERSGGEICVVRGEMIGPPGVRAARRLLAAAAAIAERAEILARREA